MNSLRTPWLRPLFVVVMLCLYSAAHARCVLPVSDGGGPRPSPANVEGDIVSIQQDIVGIRPYHLKRQITVRVPQDKPIYTAFGGDGTPSELQVGQKTRVWFVGCARGSTSVPEAAYFEIFSKDPNDRP